MENTLALVDRKMQEFSEALSNIKASLQPGDQNQGAALSLSLLETAFNAFRTLILSELAESKKRMDMLEDKQDALEAYSRRNCLLVFGIEENGARDEDESEKAILRLFNSKLKLGIEPAQIERAHRLGKVKPGISKPRPIIVKFYSYRVRRLVFLAKKNLKGHLEMIGESLTKKRLEVLNKARDIYGVRNCWTSDGKIMVKRENNGERKVYTTMNQLMGATGERKVEGDNQKHRKNRNTTPSQTAGLQLRSESRSTTRQTTAAAAAAAAGSRPAGTSTSASNTAAKKK